MKRIERVMEKISGTEYSSMTCNLASCLIGAQLMQYSSSDSCKKNHLAKNWKLYFAFVDLGKVFNWVPRKVIWWAMQKNGIEEWIVQFVQAFYNNTRSKVRVNNTYSDELGVKIGVHQGSVLNHLLFITVLEVLYWDTLGVVVCWWPSDHCWSWRWAQNEVN